MTLDWKDADETNMKRILKEGNEALEKESLRMESRNEKIDKDLKDREVKRLELEKKTSWGWVGPSLAQLELLKKFKITFRVVDEVKVHLVYMVYLVHLVVHLVP